jgi:hypothetical protein
VGNFEAQIFDSSGAMERADFGQNDTGTNGFVVSHPSGKNKDVAKVGHPENSMAPLAHWMGINAPLSHGRNLNEKNR